MKTAEEKEEQKSAGFFDKLTGDKEDKPSQKSAIFAVSEELVISPAISRNGDAIVYYSGTDGNVYEIPPTFHVGGEKKLVSRAGLSGLEEVRWSPDKNRVITKILRGESAEYYYYDYETRAGGQFPSGYQDISWTI
jgi:Tol biopolymer transport system component